MTEASESVTSESTTSEPAVVSTESTETAEGDTGPELPSESGEAIESTEEASQPADEGQRYDVKIDGQTVSLTLEELKQGVSMGKAAADKWQEAARMKKEAESSLEQFKSNPIRAAIEMGIDPAELRAHTEEYLLGELKYDEMTPEQRDIERIRKENDDYKKRETEAQEASQKTELDAQTEHYQNQYIDQFNTAFDTAGVTRNEHAYQRVASLLADSLEAGNEMPVDMAVAVYKQESDSAIQAYLQAANPEQLTKIIGNDRMKEIRKNEIAGLKNPTSSSRPGVPDEPVEKTPAQSMTDFFDNL